MRLFKVTTAEGCFFAVVNTEADLNELVGCFNPLSVYATEIAFIDARKVGSAD